MLAFSSSAIVPDRFRGLLQHDWVLFKFVLGLRRLLGCLAVWYMETFCTIGNSSLLAQLHHNHLSSQHGTVSPLSVDWFCVESSRWCSPLRTSAICSLYLNLLDHLDHWHCFLDSHLDVLHYLSTIIFIWRFAFLH